MKSFLVIVGVLAVAAAILAFLASKSAVHEILSAISLLVGCTSLGLARLIELAGEQKRAAEDAAMQQRESLAKLLAVLTAPVTRSLPPIPGLEQYFVVENASAAGPFRRDQVQALRANGTLNDESWVIHESGTVWKRYAEVFC